MKQRQIELSINTAGMQKGEDGVNAIQTTFLFVVND